MKIVHVIIANFYKEGYGYQENILPVKHIELGLDTYVVTIKSNGNSYAVRRFNDNGLFYVDNRADETYPDRIVPNPAEQDCGYMLLGRSSVLMSSLRMAFERGYVRFRNQECKGVFFNLMKYNMFN